MSLQIKQLLSNTIETLKNEGITSARLDAMLIFEYVLSKDRTYLLVHDDETLSTNQVRLISELTDRRLAHEPIAYIIGHKEFYGMSFSVTKDVLIPRPETEAIVSYVSKTAIEPGELLDVGTGSGAIAIAIAATTEHTVSASDISPTALDVARKNAEAHSVDILFYESDLLSSIENSFRIITANLPYVPIDENVNPDAKHEPSLALYSGKDGLDHYRKLHSQLTNKLLPDAIVVIEHLPSQEKALTDLFSDYRNVSISEYVTAFHAQ